MGFGKRFADNPTPGFTSRVNTEYTVDKSKFPRGPWDNEPDAGAIMPIIQGAPVAEFVRDEVSGAFKGYLCVGPSEWEQFEELPVHGGINFKGLRNSVVFKDLPRTHWIGFDCAHVMDVAPGLPWSIGMPGAKYRCIHYVIENLCLAAFSIWVLRKHGTA